MRSCGSCTATPASHCRGRSSPRCTTRSRRRAPCAATFRCSTARRRWRTSTMYASGRVPGGDDFIHELVLRHEMQHGETMLQAIEMSRLQPAPAVPRAARPAAPGGHTASRRRDPGGECAIGARPGVFAYDNELPQHRTDVRAFRIGRTPITNATYLTFVEGGGYERRPWWRAEAWAWKEQYDITHPEGVGPRARRDLAPLDAGRLGATRSRRARGPPLLVRGRRLRTSTRGSAAHRGGVGEGGDLGSGVRFGPAVSVGRRTARRVTGRTSTMACSAPRPPARYPDGASPYGVLGHARRRLGVDGERLPWLRRLRRPSVPRVLRGLLRQRLQGAARRLVGHTRARGDARRSATGTCRSGARSSPG